MRSASALLTIRPECATPAAVLTIEGYQRPAQHLTILNYIII
jgi:hypothetical protein